jgi:hypothetical protein
MPGIESLSPRIATCDGCPANSEQRQRASLLWNAATFWNGFASRRIAALEAIDAPFIDGCVVREVAHRLICFG